MSKLQLHGYVDDMTNGYHHNGKDKRNYLTIVALVNANLFCQIMEREKKIELLVLFAALGTSKRST